MKNKYNLLHKYIFDKTVKEYTKETVNGLFRSILEPVISNQKFESVILFRLLDSSEIGSTLKRLSFSGAQIYSFSDTLKEFGFDNSQKDDIWGQTQFLVLIGQRYSAALIWDYSLSDNQNTDVCLLYNSHTIID
ncbi:MAG: hypothetical protein LUG16_02605, partial [Candidatus Gastranaerophilales bacterium]|nr:hypothetical protein [Candidatus Gastranaerophilales bacterium]